MVVKEILLCICMVWQLCTATAPTDRLQDLQDGVAELAAIVEEHLSKGENEEAEEAQAVKEKFERQLAALLLTVHDGEEKETVLGGSQSFVYEDAEPTEDAFPYQPFTVEQHLLPGLQLFRNVVPQLAATSPSEYVTLFEHQRTETYGNFQHLNVDSEEREGQAGHLWNIALVEIAILNIVVIMLVIVLTRAVYRCCGVSALKIHRFVSLLAAIPLFLSCITGSVWMFCDQVCLCKRQGVTHPLSCFQLRVADDLFSNPFRCCCVTYRCYCGTTTAKHPRQPSCGCC